MTTHRVTFDRIGQRGGRGETTAPAPIDRALSGDQLADSIAMYARQFVGSRTFEVVLDMEEMRGRIFAGMRTAGTFTIEALPATESTGGDAG